MGLQMKKTRRVACAKTLRVFADQRSPCDYRGVAVALGLRVGVALVLPPGDGDPRGVTLAVGAGLVRSTVGVTVGGSRVGIGPWVGVASNVPGGRLINVVGACVGVGTRVGRTSSVGVERCSRSGRATKLIVPAQYITNVPAMTMARQP